MIPRKIKLSVWEASTLLWMAKRAPEITPTEKQVLDLIERRCMTAAARIRKDIDAMSEEGLYVDFDALSGKPAFPDVRPTLPDICSQEDRRKLE